MSEHSNKMREHLHALQEPALPDGLWQRVEVARKRKARRRRLGIGMATVALAAVLALPLIPRFYPAPTGSDAAVASQQTPRSAEEVLAELRAMDHALQVAYDRGASDAEIAPMWVARNELIAMLVPGPDRPQTNRI